MEVLQIVVLAWAVVMSVVGYFSMMIDKERAKRNAWRIKESVLFLIAAFGGVGSTLGMYAFRHKTNHWYFKYFFPILAVLDVALYVWLFITFGA